jgi:hypothetical protein
LATPSRSISGEKREGSITSRFIDEMREDSSLLMLASSSDTRPGSPEPLTYRVPRLSVKKEVLKVKFGPSSSRAQNPVAIYKIDAGTKSSSSL